LILDHIRIAQEAELPYVYLGYWVPGSQKMGYKANFSGLEVFVGGNWQKVPDPSSFSAEAHPLSTAPISEQVANIKLPNVRSTR
jgi:arginine-tRNA-protein transferase